MNVDRRIFLTGASGFVGSGVLARLLKEERHMSVAVRDRGSRTSSSEVKYFVCDLASEADWSKLLVNQDVLIHAAARVHVMDDQSSDPLAEFRKVNVDGTLRLAQQAAAVGVKRFVFISSVKVNGEVTVSGHPFTAFDTPAPQDPYGISKMEAEAGLKEIAKETDMEVVIIRPVLVYGPGVKANFLSMINWVNKGVPLPLGAIYNKRSMVALDNLVDLIVTCIDHPAAANQTFLVSDGDDLSTTELLKRTALALNKPSHLLPVPAGLLAFGAGIVGKRAIAQRLLGSLQVDITHTLDTLRWTPPVSVDDALKKTANAFLVNS